MIQTVFSRYEKKYLMPEHIYFELRKRLAEHMKEDKYGLHTICNIYYDTADDLLIRRSIEKPSYKEKLRLRSYGTASESSTVFLEIKKKCDRIVTKRREPMMLTQAMDYTVRGIRPEIDTQIMNELDFFLERYDLSPRLFLAYDRIALFGLEDGEFRVTFDQSVRSRRQEVALDAGDHGEKLLDDGYYIMESKVSGATPLWFTRILSELKLYPTSFSKYGNIYKKEMGKWDLSSQIVHRQRNWRAVSLPEPENEIQPERRLLVC